MIGGKFMNIGRLIKLDVLLDELKSFQLIKKHFLYMIRMKLLFLISVKELTD